MAVVASALALQSSTAPTPAGAPLPSKGRSSPKAVNSELEGDVKEDGVMSFARYEDGSFPLKQNKLTTYVNRAEVVLVQGKQRFAIPVKAIAEVATGGAVLTTGTKNQSVNLTVVRIVWLEAKKNSVVLRVDKADFTPFVSALESVTGLKATNTDR